MALIKYFKDLHKQYGIINFLLVSILITLSTIILDYFNIPTYIYNKLGAPIVICIMCFILVKMISLRFLSLIRLKSVNYIDFYSIVVILSTILYIVLLILFKNSLIIYSYKPVLSIIVIIIVGLILLKRYLSITIAKPNKNIENIFDLKQLYDNTIPKDAEFILIGDEAVNYDLLERNKIINQITNTIINCNNTSKFVMSLKGTWGSGKTTILKNVKKNLSSENLIFIDDFEPWIYADKKALLVAFFDTIMKNINCGFRITEINKFTKIYLKTITANIGYSADSLLDANISVDRIREVINNYLELNNKKIVLVLDNLERCSSDNILFILKTIHNLFDFKRIIYFLSYDEKIMKKHFASQLKIDYSYLEKMIQLEFNVPKLDVNVLHNVMYRCLNNYINHSKYVIDEKKQHEIIETIINNVKDLRDFKRIINSTFNASFNNVQDLNSVDMLLIETIALKNPELWDEINNNSAYYISEDRYVYNNEYIYNTEKYNKDTTQYFNNLFNNDKYINYKRILCYLFPNVKKYIEETKNGKKEKIEFIQEYQKYIDENEYRASVIDKRVYNSKYFNIYFNKTRNEFIEINKRIEDFISFINNNDFDTKKLYEKYFQMEKVYPGWVEKYVLETFQMNLNKIKTEKIFLLLTLMYNTYYNLDDSPLFLQLNAKSRNQVIIADLILMLSDNEFSNFIENIKNDYKNVYFIREITYWLKPEHRRDKLINASRYEALNILYENMKNDIKQNSINMYSRKYYNRYNMILLFEDEEYMSLIKKKINKNNLMLFILDCINISTGSYGIGYKFDVEKLNKFYGWDRAKRNIKNCPNSDLKQFLIKAIEASNQYSSEDEKDTYHTDEWISLNDLIIKYLNR